MELNLIRVQAIAARLACEQMTEAALRALRDSVDRASCLPARPGWERKPPRTLRSSAC
jgi:DNA-binding GntR family transcriptional regulator